MRIGEYLVGRKLELRSPLSPDEVSKRINAAASLIYRPFGLCEVIGGSYFGFVRLGFFTSDLQYNASPVLFGRLQERLGSTEIRARFGAPIWVKVIFGIWSFVFFLALWVLLFSPAGLAPGADWRALSIIVPLLIILPVAMHLIGTRNSESELERILEFLSDYAEARPV